MRTRRIALEIAVIVASAVAAVGQSGSPLSLHDFRNVLQNTRDVLSQQGEARIPLDRTQLPDSWTIHEGGREFKVSTEWLRDGLKKMADDPAHAKDTRESLLAKISALDSEAEGVDTSLEAGAARTRLTAILARREFGHVHGPSLWDRLRQRINNLLFKIFSRIFGSQAAPAIGAILIWLVILGAVGVLAWWIRKLFVRPSEIMSIAGAPANLPDKDWRARLRESRGAAAAGQWRDAIRLAYWAAVYAIEERGVWRSDRARTPREYLRQLDTDSAYRPPLQSLTTIFEKTWYAGSPADASTYERVSKSLEELECR